MSTTVAGVVETDDEIDAALDRALANPGVTVIDAHVSRNVPPLPAHITREYALNTATSLLKGDPHEAGVVADAAKALVAEQVHRVAGALHLGHRDRRS